MDEQRIEYLVRNIVRRMLVQCLREMADRCEVENEELHELLNQQADHIEYS